jgi:DNA-binding MarR family transcriptional regulator
MEIPKSVAEYISRHGLSNTGSRVLFFLLQHPEPVSTKDISAAVGVSPKTINKAIRKLKEAGLLERGELEAQKRRFVM